MVKGKDGASLTISWNRPDDDGGLAITGYSIYKGADSSNMTFLKKLSERTYEDTKVEPGKVYHYAIASLNSLGEGERSDVLDAGLPDKVWPISVTEGDGWVRLGWDLPARDGGHQVEGYSVHRGKDDSNMTLVGNVFDPVFTDRSVENGVTYKYAIQAFSSVGSGALSDTVNATPGTVPGAPGYLMTRSTHGNIRLTWGGPETTGGYDVTEYKVYRGTSVGELVELMTVADRSYVDKDVKVGKKYYYRVTAINDKGEGAPTDTANQKVPEPVDDSMLMLLAIIVIMIGVVVATVLILRKRRTPPEEEIADEEAPISEDQPDTPPPEPTEGAGDPGWEPQEDPSQAQQLETEGTDPGDDYQ
jgi:fibronectin type 3 domain-containing protein